MTDTLNTVTESLFTSINIFAALIGIVGTILVALLTSWLTYRFTRKARLEAEWRIDKLHQYRELMSALTEISNALTDEEYLESQSRYTKAANMISLVASQKIIDILADLNDVVIEMETNKSEAKKLLADQYMEYLILEFRKDLKISPVDDPKTFEFRLLTTEYKSNGD